jgi:hypothetical protein
VEVTIAWFQQLKLMPVIRHFAHFVFLQMMKYLEIK